MISRMGDAKVNVLYLAGTDEPHFSESFKSNNRDKKKTAPKCRDGT
jgi:hypothetical protein